MSIFISFVIGVIIGYAFRKFENWSNEEDCPRAYMGYNCRGSSCDHSREAWTDITNGKK